MLKLTLPGTRESGVHVSSLLCRFDPGKSCELTLHLEDGDDEDLVRKNKKKKSLGFIMVRLVLSPLTKEEYNEVAARGLHSVFTLGILF